MDQPTIFQKIIAREIPAHIVYEDDKVIAFLDINPVNPGHTLVVPKEFSVNLFDMSAETAATLAQVVQKIAKAVCSAVGADAFNLEVNNGATAGQIVMHAHWHIIPRTPTDGLKHWPGKPYGEGEAGVVAEKIKAAL